VKATVEPLEGNKVKLSVEVDEAEFEQALDTAFRQLAREVRIPGFRPGKAPRKVLEARLGTGVARDEALRSAVPDYYEQAVREHEVDVIAAPEVDITAGQDEGAVAFDAVVEVRPVITISGYDDLTVTVPAPVASEEDVQEQLDELRSRFATLEVVDRAATDDDHVTIDITGSQGGEELGGLTTQDYDYTVGIGAVVPELDENLRGAKAGDILEFDAAHPDPEQEGLHFRILVKEVQAPVLPELDDDFAQQASEFETIAELRAEIEKNLGLVRRARSAMALTDRAAEALGELVDVEISEALVARHAEELLQNIAMSAAAQGLSLEQYFTLTGKTPDEISADLKERGERAAKIDLALRALAEAEDLEVTEEQLDAEFAEASQRMGRAPAEIRAEFERSGSIAAVRSDLRKRGALEWLLERVEIVDDDGNPLARSDLELPSDEDTDQDTDEDEVSDDAGEPGAETDQHDGDVAAATPSDDPADDDPETDGEPE
jgi:trigger factor